MKSGLPALLLAVWLPAAAAAPEPTHLLATLAGDWDLAGTVLGKPAHYRAHGRWVLHGGWLEFSMVDLATPPGYEARVFIGYDAKAKRLRRALARPFRRRRGAGHGHGQRPGWHPGAAVSVRGRGVSRHPEPCPRRSQRQPAAGSAKGRRQLVDVRFLPDEASRTGAGNPRRPVVRLPPWLMTSCAGSAASPWRS